MIRTVSFSPFHGETFQPGYTISYSEMGVDGTDFLWPSALSIRVQCLTTEPISESSNDVGENGTSRPGGDTVSTFKTACL